MPAHHTPHRSAPSSSHTNFKQLKWLLELPSHPAWPPATMDHRGQGYLGHVAAATASLPSDPCTGTCQTSARQPWALTRRPRGGRLAKTLSKHQPFA